jgi:hypothetical protein
VGLRGTFWQAGQLARVAEWPSFQAAPTFGSGCPVHRPSLTLGKAEFEKAPTPGRPAKEVGLAGSTLARLGPGFVPHHPLMSYSL